LFSFTKAYTPTLHKFLKEKIDCKVANVKGEVLALNFTLLTKKMYAFWVMGFVGRKP
jgi:hypothetical protein